MSIHSFKLISAHIPLLTILAMILGEMCAHLTYGTVDGPVWNAKFYKEVNG